MRKLLLAAFFCISLATGSGVAAQGANHNFLYTVEGWPKMAGRADGKGEILSWSWGLSEPAPTATAKPAPSAGAKFHDLSVTTWLDDRVVLFMRHSLEGRPLKTVLFESFPASVAKPAPRAPFAIRLSEVRVTSVQTGGSVGNDRLTANVSFSASKVEIFTAHPTATGTMQPGQQLGWDVKAGKGM
jgi:type VI secretion system secreted protein Hcp